MKKGKVPATLKKRNAAITKMFKERAIPVSEIARKFNISRVRVYELASKSGDK